MPSTTEKPNKPISGWEDSQLDLKKLISYLDSGKEITPDMVDYVLNTHEAVSSPLMSDNKTNRYENPSVYFKAAGGFGSKQEVPRPC